MKNVDYLKVQSFTLNILYIKGLQKKMSNQLTGCKKAEIEFFISTCTNVHRYIVLCELFHYIWNNYINLRKGDVLRGTHQYIGTPSATLGRIMSSTCILNIFKKCSLSLYWSYLIINCKKKIVTHNRTFLLFILVFNFQILQDAISTPGLEGTRGGLGQGWWWMGSQVI